MSRSWSAQRLDAALADALPDEFVDDVRALVMQYAYEKCLYVFEVEEKTRTISASILRPDQGDYLQHVSEYRFAASMQHGMRMFPINHRQVGFYTAAGYREAPPPVVTYDARDNTWTARAVWPDFVNSTQLI